MKYTFLGQAGFLIESGDVKIIVDPYLSDSVSKVNPKNYRRAPIDEGYFDVDPDFLCAMSPDEKSIPRVRRFFLQRRRR